MSRHPSCNISGAEGVTTSPATPDQTAAERPNASVPQLAHITWLLQIQPTPLNTAFWHEQTTKYARWDAQVAWFFAVLLVPLTFHSVRDCGWAHALGVFAPAWVNQFGWLLATHQYQDFYSRHRLPLLVLVRAMLTYQTLYATNQIRDRLYEVTAFTKHAPFTSLAIKTTLMASVPYMPIWALCMPLPLRLQFFVTASTALVFFLGGSLREMVICTNTPADLQILDFNNAAWFQLVQSGSPMLIQAHANLQDRSASMFLTLGIIYLSAVAGIMYIVYIIQWSELRQWLKHKARTAPTPGRGEAGRSVVINGVSLSQGQLLGICHTPAAHLLLEGQSMLGYASMALLHGAVLLTLCLASALLSQVLVLQVAPRVLPTHVLAMYYPLRPEVEQGMCMPDTAPQFSGWLGRLLLVLDT